MWEISGEGQTNLHLSDGGRSASENKTYTTGWFSLSSLSPEFRTEHGLKETAQGKIQREDPFGSAPVRNDRCPYQDSGRQAFVRKTCEKALRRVITVLSQPHPNRTCTVTEPAAGK
eukprot:1182628-Prorocentrum_minimum.AAC.3